MLDLLLLVIVFLQLFYSSLFTNFFAANSSNAIQPNESEASKSEKPAITDSLAEEKSGNSSPKTVKYLPGGGIE